MAEDSQPVIETLEAIPKEGSYLAAKYAAEDGEASIKRSYEPHLIDADYSPNHGVVRFRNGDQKYFVMSANKAASNARSLREAASLIKSSDERPRAVAAWLNELAEKFEKCEGE